MDEEIRFLVINRANLRMTFNLTVYDDMLDLYMKLTYFIESNEEILCILAYIELLLEEEILEDVYIISNRFSFADLVKNRQIDEQLWKALANGDEKKIKKYKTNLYLAGGHMTDFEEELRRIKEEGE